MTQSQNNRRAWKRSQRGSTLMLALAGILVALVMAALAIDISTLYLAHSEAQRTADAAALAGARAFVVSAVTTDLAPSSRPVADLLAAQQIDAVLQQNLIAGRPGQLAPPSPPLTTNPFTDYTTNPSNPTIIVSVQQQNLPTFFSRIWSRVPNSVTATAKAEAYNPSGSSANPPVSAQCVKPFIVPNQDPEHPTGPTSFEPFLNLADGSITHPGRIWSFGAGVVGEWITFNVNCLGVVSGCPGGTPSAHNPNPPNLHCTPNNTYCSLDFVPAAPPASPLSCPSCGGGGRQLEQNIACCNTAALSCNSATPMTQMITDLNGPPPPHTSVDQGLQCLIHQNPGLGMDSLDPTGFPSNGGAPFRFVAGANNPLTLAPNPVVASGDGVSTSDSIITLLIADSFNPVPTPPTADIVGFMQVFVVQGNGGGSFTGVVLNISGCGTTAGTAAPIVGGGISPVPVRLIHN